MNTLVIDYQSGLGGEPSQVRVQLHLKGDGTVRSSPYAPLIYELSQEHLDCLQWYWEQYEFAPWHQESRARQVEKVIIDLGQNLFDQVFSGPARDIYQNAAQAFDRCRMVIQADSAQGFALPWEWMFDKARGEFGFLAGAVHDLVRCMPNQSPTAVPPPNLPILQVLVVITAKAGDDSMSEPVPVIRPLIEWARSHRHRLRMDVLAPATLDRLQEVLRQKAGFYQLVHFEGLPLGLGSDCGPGIAHAASDEPRPVPSTATVMDVLKMGGVKAVVINSACRGRPAPRNCLSGAGQIALASGLNAVLTLAYAVAPGQGLRFFRRFYEALVNGETLGRATRLGQEELRLHAARQTIAGELNLLDWALPTAFEQAPLMLLPKPHTAHRLSPVSHPSPPPESEIEIDCPPPPVLGFVGRYAEIAELERLAARHAVVVIHGLAGIGKTELAVSFARWQALDETRDGPILMITAYPTISVDAVYDRVGQLFEEQIGEEQNLYWGGLHSNQRRTLAQELLRRVPILIILDHLSSATNGPARECASNDGEKEWIDLFESMAGGRSRILITARRAPVWLPKTAGRLELKGLSPAPARELALRILQSSSARPFKAPVSMGNLMEFLNGNPLAMQIALPMTRRVRPDQLLAAFSEASARMPAGCIEDTGPSLGGVIQDRIESLDPSFSARLGLLGMFQRSVTARVLAAICWRDQAPQLLQGMGREDWTRCLESATELGLLRCRFESNFVIPPAIEPFFRVLFETHYGEHRLWAEAAFAAAYGRAGNQLYVIYQADAEFALSMLRSEELNFRSCYALARRHKWWDDLKENLCGLRTLLVSIGCWTEWERLIAQLEPEIIPSSPPLKPDSEVLWFRLLGHRAEICEYRRDKTSLASLRDQLIEFSGITVPSKSHSDMLHDLGVVTLAKGYCDEAERFFQKSLAVKQQQGDESGQIALCEHLARTAKLQKQYRDAKRWFESARQIATRLGSTQTEASLHYEIGMVDQERGEFDEAREQFVRARSLFETLGCRQETALVLHQLGRIAQAERQFEQAEQCYHQSLALKEQLNDDSGRARSLHQLGNLAFYQRHYAQARDYYLQALDLRERLGEREVCAQTLYRLGNNAFMLEHYDQAQQYYLRSLAIRKEFGDSRAQARLLNQLGKVSMALDRRDEALQYYERAELLFDQLKTLVI